jgi:hypothetical protein
MPSPDFLVGHWAARIATDTVASWPRSIFSGIVLSASGNDQVTLTTPGPRLVGTGSVLGIPTPIVLVVGVLLFGQPRVASRRTAGDSRP